MYSLLRLCIWFCVCVFGFAFVYLVLRLCIWFCVCVFGFAFVYSPLRLCIAPLGHRSIILFIRSNAAQVYCNDSFALWFAQLDIHLGAPH